ncbi:MAG: transglutaminase domain-containing protein [Eubacterium sp.]|nr:transglutaminase domain-containing protein [Eubacterium sp.]
MGKRLQLIPLVLLLLCSGTSMSSGLYYYEVKDIIYFIHVFLVALVFYCVRHFIGMRRHRELYSLGVSLVALCVCFFTLRKFLLPGFRALYNQISDNVYLTAGIELGQWNNTDSEYVGLAICQIVALITALTLYFYETKKPVAVTLLPSFLVFILPILIDGVPYEACVIVYGLSFIVFVGMGRYGGNAVKLVFLVGAVFLACGVAVTSFSWKDVDPVLQDYREQIMVGGNGVRQQGSEKIEEKKEKKEQTIHFGQFSQVGSIHYNGTIELFVTRLTDFFEKDKLYIRGFIGNTFKDNLWYGPHMKDSYDLRGMACERESSVEIENAYDKGNYAAYAMDEGGMPYYTYYGYNVPERYKGKFNKKTLKVEKNLKNRIRKEIIGEDTKFFSLYNAIDFTMEYLNKNYRYTLRPGMVQDGENEIETFLFERKTGYCTHFASAAVMILRTLGVPARLAQGYMISGYRVNANKKTSVRDSNAHAWVELYIDGTGWVPVDFTPSSTNADALAGRDPDNGQSEWDAEENDRDEPEMTEQPDEKDETEEDDASEEDGDEGENEAELNEVSPSESRIVFRMMLVVLCLASLFLAGIWLRHLWRYRCMKRTFAKGDACRKLVCLNDNMRGIWRRMGVRWEYTDSKGLMKQILHKTQKYYVFSDARELAELQEQIRGYVLGVYRSRYSAGGILDEEYFQCQKYITQLLLNIRQRGEAKLWRRMKSHNIVKILVKRGKRNGSE